MKAKKVYTISTQVFTSLEAAKKKLVDYAYKGDYRNDSKIFVATEVYEVEIVRVAKTKKINFEKAEEDPLTLH